jgi:RNA polymerase sigma-70 factor, ECF subfamily
MAVKESARTRRRLSVEEIEAVYRRDAAAFERVAIAVVGDEQLGCDAVHDAFVQALRNRGSFRGDAPVVAWLWRIVINEARKRRRHQAGIVAVDPTLLDAGADGDAEPAAAGLETARVRAAIVRLPERQRLALFLRHYADLDYATIAGALGVRPGTVAATLNAARAQLRVALEEVHEWEL